MLGLPYQSSSSLDYSVVDVSSGFSKLLLNYDIEVSRCYAYYDPKSNAIFINLTDSQGDSVDAILRIDDDGVPGISILGDSDEEVGWIDLEGVVPVVSGRIEVGDWAWLRKSVVKNMMQLKNVDYTDVSELSLMGKMKSAITEAFTVKGSSRSIIVTHRKRSRKIPDNVLLGLAAARRQFQLSLLKLSLNR